MTKTVDIYHNKIQCYICQHNTGHLKQYWVVSNDREQITVLKWKSSYLHDNFLAVKHQNSSL